MASIVKKKIKKSNYYYYVESKRVGGKPKPVNQKYLGSADSILKKVLSANESLKERVLYSDVAEFGAIMLVFDIAKRLRLTEIIDCIIPKRKQGASAGLYILTAILNRVASPSSKSGLAEWYANTCLPYVMGYKPNTFTPQNFWNNTCISEKEVERIEEAVLSKVLDTYQIDTSHLIYDATNFFTYIDTMQKSELAKRGHSKEKRNDLRIVGLSLMVSPEFSIPLLHETYPGNIGDAKEFPVMMERLKSRYESITGRAADITAVFDRGNNSENNLDILESGKFKLHYVGGLKKNQATELFAVDFKEYTPLKGASLEGQYAYRSKMEVFGRSVTAVIVYNPELEKGQMQGILINRERTGAKLHELQQRLIRRATGEVTKGKKPTAESVNNAVQAILETEYMSDIFSCTVTEKDGYIFLTYEPSDNKLEEIRCAYLGKTVLFTDRSSFTNEQIVTYYRSAWHVEAAFKQLKDTKHLTVRPIFHWTDEKIRVHIFICVMAFRLCCLLLKELSEYGIHVSINKLIEEMSCIRRVHTFFGDINKPEKVASFSNGSTLAMQIEQLYKLKEKYS
jgi:transposase